MEVTANKSASSLWEREPQLNDMKEQSINGKEYYLVNHFASIQRTYPAKGVSQPPAVLKDEETVSGPLLKSIQSAQVVSTFGHPHFVNQSYSWKDAANLKPYDYIIEQSVLVAILVGAILLYVFAVTIFFLNIAFLTVYFSFSWNLFINLAILFFPPLAMLFYPSCFFLYFCCALFWCSVVALSILGANIGATSFYMDLKDTLKCMTRFN